MAEPTEQKPEQEQPDHPINSEVLPNDPKV